MNRSRAIGLTRAVCGGIAAVLAVASATPAQPAHSPATGSWLTEDHDGIIELYACGGEICGRLAWFRMTPEDVGKPPNDSHNPSPALRGRPLCRLDMLGGFKPAGARQWTDGWIYNPENGKTYSARMTLEGDNQLRLRGYVGIPLFGETQLWTRADTSIARCSMP